MSATAPACCRMDEDSDIEPVKGGLSDSMKRAAVQWGIGRTLYNMDTVFVGVEKQGRSWVIKKSDRGKLDNAYLDMLGKLKLKPAPPIGTQSELTQGQAENSAGGSAPAPTAGQAKPAQKLEKEPAPVYDCIVRTAMRQKGITSVSTMVALVYPDGSIVNAYARGESPDLIPGAMLAGVKLARRQQDTVVFYVLETYQIVGTAEKAA